MPKIKVPPQATDNLQNVDPKNLTGTQDKIYKLVEAHELKSETNIPPLQMVIQGEAGTGKSYLIKCLQKLLGKKLKVGAFTAQAAANIDGQTLHSLFNLYPTRLHEELNATSKHMLKTEYEDLEYIILDEFSMIGCNFMHCIDRRLREIGND